jgi:hydroxyethylthiazole kinase-like uncharacterized protein yjeF
MCAMAIELMKRGIKMKLVHVDEMRLIEKEANDRGYAYQDMLVRAGKELAGVVAETYVHLAELTVFGLVGSGNNGGDTLVALSTLAEKGWKVKAYLTKARANDDGLVKQLLACGGELTSAKQDADFKVLDEWLQWAGVMLDGVLGTGAQLPLHEDVSRILSHVNTCEELPFVVAVDCPSGVDCQTGQAADETIPADMTVCMQAVKMGLLQFPAFKFVGDIEVVELGLPDGLDAWNKINREVAEVSRVRAILPKRPDEGHKGTFGTVLVVAGSVNYTGAALLSGKAAYRIGAGLVQMAIPGALHAALAGHLPEATWLLLPHEMGVISEKAYELVANQLERVDALLIGPGWGQEDTTGEFLSRLITGNVVSGRLGMGFLESPGIGKEERTVIPFPPMVVDADALKLLARIPDWQRYLPKDTVLTPHPGEMSGLTGLDVADIQNSRMETALEFAQRWGHVVVLKGAFTVIAAPDGREAVIPIATSALAHAGSGDVLAGIITGLRAQKVPAYEAALAGAWIHGRTGLMARDWLGHAASVLAGDLLEMIPEVLRDL